ncbi:MAG: complement resistance protein TraT [Nitrospinota bacterium]
MIKPSVKNIAVMAAIFIASVFASGCATTGEAISSRKLETSVKMSETIFLEPVEPEQQVVWIKIRNTSDRQDLDAMMIESVVRSKIEQRGYRVTKSPSEAHYRLQANVLFADHEKKDLTEDAMMIGGFGGALAGSEIGGGGKAKMATGLGGAVVGSVVGGLLGSMVQIDKWLLVVDVQISEKVPGGVDTSSAGSARAGNVRKTQNATGRSDFINYQTRIVGTAKQTNMDWNVAQPILLNGFSNSLAGLF